MKNGKDDGVAELYIGWAAENKCLNTFDIDQSLITRVPKPRVCQIWEQFFMDSLNGFFIRPPVYGINCSSALYLQITSLGNEFFLDFYSKILIGDKLWK